jgi:hypothetical protein
MEVAENARFKNRLLPCYRKVNLTESSWFNRLSGFGTVVDNRGGHLWRMNAYLA